MPCLEFLAQLREHHDTFSARGATVIAVGGAADYQAQRLQDDGHLFPLLLDPDGVLRRALGIETQLSRKEMMSWASIKKLCIGYAPPATRQDQPHSRRGPPRYRHP